MTDTSRGTEDVEDMVGGSNLIGRPSRRYSAGDQEKLSPWLSCGSQDSYREPSRRLTRLRGESDADTCWPRGSSMLVQGGGRSKSLGAGLELRSCSGRRVPGGTRRSLGAHEQRQQQRRSTYGRVAKATDCWWPAAAKWLVVRTTDAVVVRPMSKEEVVTAMWTRQNCGVRGQIRSTAAPSRPCPTGARRLGR